MRYENPFAVPALSGLFETLLPDFVLGFAFFTAVSYGVLSKRFDHQRTAAAMSGAMGAALATGLVWWQYDRGWSIRDLGPFAFVLAIIVLSATIYHAVRRIGGSWAGVGITLGLSILITGVFGVDWPLAASAITTVATVALIFGLLLFLLHHHRTGIAPTTRYASQSVAEADDARQEIARLHRDRCLSARLTDGFRRLRKDADLLRQRPEETSNVAAQIQRLLPAEGWLTQRMARLRAKAHRVRKGQIARLEETRHICRSLEGSAKRRIAADLVGRYQNLVGMQKRLERLDKVVAENERRIRNLTRQAERATQVYDFQRLIGLIEQASKLQGHNEKIFRAIERTERKLADVAHAVAREAREVTGR